MSVIRRFVSLALILLCQGCLGPWQDAPQKIVIQPRDDQGRPVRFHGKKGVSLKVHPLQLPTWLDGTDLYLKEGSRIYALEGNQLVEPLGVHLSQSLLAYLEARYPNLVDHEAFSMDSQTLELAMTLHGFWVLREGADTAVVLSWTVRLWDGTQKRFLVHETCHHIVPVRPWSQEALMIALNDSVRQGFEKVDALLRPHIDPVHPNNDERS